MGSMRASHLFLGLCLGCGGASQAPAAARPSIDAEAKVASQPPQGGAELGMPDAMQVHFAYVTAARDAIIAGRLDEVRPALLALAAAPAGRIEDRNLRQRAQSGSIKSSIP